MNHKCSILTRKQYFSNKSTELTNAPNIFKVRHKHFKNIYFLVYRRDHRLRRLEEKIKGKFLRVQEEIM